jgi:hypothetical protein
MAVLFFGAIALIFYILLLRAQSLSNMEQRRQDPGASMVIERVAISSPAPLVYVQSGSGISTAFQLVIPASS